MKILPIKDTLSLSSLILFGIDIFILFIAHRGKCQYKSNGSGLLPKMIQKKKAWEKTQTFFVFIE
jgi:hypothetical protein